MSATRIRCPICNEPADTHYKPFCSKRCADIDLNRWLSGTYAIPGEDASPDDLPTREEGEDTDDR